MEKGKNVTIYPGAKLCYPENIHLGNNVIIDDFVFVVAKKEVIIGSYVHIASFTSITGGGSFFMGKYSTLSSGVRIFTGTENLDGMLGAAVPYPYRKPLRSRVAIFEHCMVGANSVILPGVLLPPGVVIGAMSLVLEDQDLEPWSIYAGCPVRRLRGRPRDSILELERRFHEQTY